MTLWNGTFAFKKSIGTIRFFPIADMSARDWAWLDYDNLRETAKNRIANMLVRGDLRGFFQVNIVEKAKAKDEYFWPASPALLEEFMDTSEASFFTHEANADEETLAVESLEALRIGIRYLPISNLLALASVVGGVAAKRGNESNREEAGKVDEELLESIRPEDRDLLLSAILLWEYALEEAEEVIDSMPEGDEVDELRDWINDRVAEVDSARASV